MEEYWERWRPYPDLAPQYGVVTYKENSDEFRILLFDEKDWSKEVWVVFDTTVEAYRTTDESYRLQTIYFLNDKYGGEFYASWTFFKVQNSLYLKWLQEESEGTFAPDQFQHFAFIDDDLILDVVCMHEPRFEFVTSVEKESE